MTSDPENDDLLAQLLAGHLEDPLAPPPSGTDPQVWAQMKEMAETTFTLRASTAAIPPLEQDPLAAALGLVVDEQFSLDGRALARARKAAGVTVSGLASSLAAQSWTVRTGDVLRWETRSAGDVSPALIASIADTLRVSPDSIVLKPAPAASAPSADVTSTDRFGALARRFAAVRGVPASMAASMLRSRGLATVHRGGPPDADSWLDSLEAFVAALEEQREP